MYPERSCQNCSDSKKREFGCEASWEWVLEEGGELERKWEGKAAVPVMVDGEPWYQCPRRPILDNTLWFNSLYSSYTHYRNGFLSDPGSVNEQPYKLMSLFELLARYEGECRGEKDKEGKGVGDTPSVRSQKAVKGDPRKRG